MVKLYPQHYLMNGSTPIDLSTVPQPKDKNWKRSRPLIIHTKVFTLERLSLPASIILVPTMCMTSSMISPWIWTYLNFITISNKRGFLTSLYIRHSQTQVWPWTQTVIHHGFTLNTQSIISSISYCLFFKSLKTSLYIREWIIPPPI